MPTRRTNPPTYGHARRLRRTPTPPESRRWAHLRRNQLQGVSFRRQRAIGRYVVDFCSPRHRLVIELDGSAHLRQRAIDSTRTIALEKLGFRVLRFWNQQIMNDMDGVARVILDALSLTQQKDPLRPSGTSPSARYARGSTSGPHVHLGEAGRG